MAKKKSKEESLTKKVDKSANGTVAKGRSIFTYIKGKITRRRLIVLLIIIAAIIGWKIYSNQKAEKEAETATIKIGDVSEELILTGEIKADLHTQMRFPTSGKLGWIGVSEGDWVYKGQALASLNKTTLDAAYQQARSNLRKYDATVDRVHDDLKDKDETETFTEIETRVTAEASKDYYYDEREKGLMMAIEVKYAKRNYGSDFRKLSKLQKMTDYPIIPVFAYVGYTTKNGDDSSQYKHLLNLAKHHNSILLFGDPHKTGDWTVDNFTNVQGVM